MQGHSTRMFTEITRFSAERLRGNTVLDLSCGPGRFADAALEAGA